MKATVTILLVLLGLSACQRQPIAKHDLDDLASRYVALAAELGDHDPDSLDFYIKSVTASTLSASSYAKLQDDAVKLREEVQGVQGDAQRKSYLIGQLNALALRTEQLQGRDRSFDEESRVLFGVVAPYDTGAAARRSIRLALADLSPGAANEAAAYSRYEAQFVVPANRVPAVMSAALDQCRMVTQAHMALPVGEHIDVMYVSHKPWSAFSRYLGNAHSALEINMDYPLTVDRILNLACHEGYPGHHVFNSVRDQLLVQTLHRDEFRVQPTFSPQSFVSEAAANYAPSLLTEQDRFHIELDKLMPLAGLRRLDVTQYLRVERLVYGLHTAEPSIARDYLDGRLEFVRAADALEREVLMEHPESLLLYLNEFRSYMLAYTIGSDAVQEMVETGNPSESERWHRYSSLMTNPLMAIPALEQK